MDDLVAVAHGHVEGFQHHAMREVEQRGDLLIAASEGTASVLVNRQMNKSQQMRWSRLGADLLLRVRCAVYNGRFGSACGQKFWPANDSSLPMAIRMTPDLEPDPAMAALRQRKS
jgi:hypothetical protein